MQLCHTWKIKDTTIYKDLQVIREAYTILGALGMPCKGISNKQSFPLERFSKEAKIKRCFMVVLYSSEVRCGEGEKNGGGKQRWPKQPFSHPISRHSLIFFPPARHPLRFDSALLKSTVTLVNDTFFSQQETAEIEKKNVFNFGGNWQKPDKNQEKENWLCFIVFGARIRKLQSTASPRVSKLDSGNCFRAAHREKKVFHRE